MSTRFLSAAVIAGTSLLGGLAAAQELDHRIVVRDRTHAIDARAYQGKSGPEQTERVSRKVKIGSGGSMSIDNISGDIVITGGSGDEVSIEAVKRTHRDKSQLGQVQVDIDERAGRVDIKTRYPQSSNTDVSVDYTITVPAGATVEVKSVSGNIKVTGVQGPVRSESVSGDVTTSGTPKLQLAKSVSGNIDLTGAATDGDLTVNTISGDVRANGLKARTLQVGSVSGDVHLSNVACERLGAKSVSGNVEYGGTLVKAGRYELNSHSGNVRLTIPGDVGFELNANTFSGSIRSDLPLTIGGEGSSDVKRRGVSNRSMHATFGDGSAVLTIRTFSGNIVIAKP